MTTVGYDFHPEAEIDLDAIWEFIAEDSQLAADRTVRHKRAVNETRAAYVFEAAPEEE